MTKREIAALICKALGIQTLIGAINLTPLLYATIISAIAPGPLGGTTWLSNMNSIAVTSIVMQLVPFVFSVIAGLYLWFRADDLSVHMVKESATNTEIEPIVVGAQAQQLVFVGLGLYTLLKAIPALCQYIITYIQLTRQEAFKSMIQRESFEAVPQLVNVSVQLALGFWLLFGASGLVRLLASVRGVGVDKRQEVEE